MSCLHHPFTTLCYFFPFENTVMHLGYLQFQEKCLCGGVAFIIKILIKSLSNVSYLFIQFTEDEMIDKI